MYRLGTDPQGVGGVTNCAKYLDSFLFIHRPFIAGWKLVVKWLTTIFSWAKVTMLTLDKGQVAELRKFLDQIG